MQLLLLDWNKQCLIKKIKTAIYLIEYGHLCPVYVGFAINSEKEIYQKLNQLKMLTKTYFLEEVLEHGLLPREKLFQ